MQQPGASCSSDGLLPSALVFDAINREVHEEVAPIHRELDHRTVARDRSQHTIASHERARRPRSRDVIGPVQ